MSAKKVGKTTILYTEPVWMAGTGNVVGTLEHEGPLGHLFDEVSQETNDLFGEDSWEKAESALQKKAVEKTLENTNLCAKDIRYALAGDLLGQSIASSFGMKSFEIPLFGLFGACSTCGESLCLGSMMIAADMAERVLCVTSSHFASAQKEFRYPLEYGGQRPLYASWTVTGSAGFVLGRCEPKKSSKKKVGIIAITPGKIIDFGIRDSFNMGCAMAPAACDTILRNLKDMEVGIDFYDAIITGDLGNVGSEALYQLMEKEGIFLQTRHLDCGKLIYDTKTQDVHAGGSGCGCCAVVLSAYILPKLWKGDWHRVLFLPTGALLNKTSFNEGQPIPGIAHAVVIEAFD